MRQLCKDSSMTVATLARMTMIRRTSNAFPAGVSCPKMTSYVWARGEPSCPAEWKFAMELWLEIQRLKFQARVGGCSMALETPIGGRG